MLSTQFHLNILNTFIEKIKKHLPKTVGKVSVKQLSAQQLKKINLVGSSNFVSLTLVMSMKAVLFLGAPWGGDEDLLACDASSCSTRTGGDNGITLTSPCFMTSRALHSRTCVFLYLVFRSQREHFAPGGFLSSRHGHGSLLCSSAKLTGLDLRSERHTNGGAVAEKNGVGGVAAAGLLSGVQRGKLKEAEPHPVFTGRGFLAWTCSTSEISSSRWKSSLTVDFRVGLLGFA